MAQQDTLPSRPTLTTPLQKQVPATITPRQFSTGNALNPSKDTASLAPVLTQADSVSVDTLVSTLPVRDSIWLEVKHSIGSDSARFAAPAFLKFTHPVRYTATRKRWEGKESVFYSVIALLILFALLKNAFNRYVGDLFRTFFQTTIRQRQIRDQMLQSPLPSLLFNIFFVLTGGLFAALLFRELGWTGGTSLLFLTLYAAAALGIIYLGKFFVLHTMGWLLDARETTGTYIFIVFTANKVLGIILLPFVVLLAFTQGFVQQGAVTLSIIVIVSVFLYRYLVSYMAVSRSLRIHFLHFLLYLAAFEILPLLLINKLLFTLLDQLY